MMMKRKAVDQVNHDFSDFSLSSPATKIRRLDHGELAAIMEEDEQVVLQEDQTISAAVGEVENEERAIVLFNPSNTIIDSPPCTFSLTPHFLSRLKDQPHLWSKHSNLFNNSSSHEQDKEEEDYDDISNQCLAVVPWVQSRLSLPPLVEPSETMMMEAELDNQQEVASMDIEQESNYNGYAAAISGIESRPPTEPSVGFHQWQQQHCMVPSHLPPHNADAAPAPAPVVWFH